MIGFRTTQNAQLRKTASRAAPSLAMVPSGTVFVGDDDVDGMIKTQIIALSPEVGFINSAHAVEVDVEPEPIQAEGILIFCRIVTKVARDLGLERDYLMALAYCRSQNLTAFGGAESKEIGPFQFSEADWKAAITTGPAKDKGYSEADRFRWYHQPAVAGLVAMAWVTKLTDATALGHAPNFTELYFAQRFGDSAEKILKRPREEQIKLAIDGEPPVGSYAAELKKGLETIGAVLTKLEKCLTDGLVEALKVVDAQPPEIRFFRVSEMDPPWLAVARDEMQRIVVEIPGDRSNDRITLYHVTAGVADSRDSTPWCGSFVTFCMKKSGLPVVENAVPSSPALARSWSTWGRSLNAGEKPPIGAVVVVNDGGHVGFLAERPVGETEPEDKFIWILGGNQGNPRQVGIVRFPRNPTDQYRWLDFPLPVAKIGKVDAKTMRDAGIAITKSDDKFIELAPRIMADLMKKLPPLSDMQAAAILGNIGHECAGFHHMREIGANGIAGGYGWCQWTGPRRDSFHRFVDDLDKPWNAETWEDYEANLGYLILELTDPHAMAASATGKALSELRKATKLSAAVQAFEQNFERAGVKHSESRERFAQLALAAM